MDKPKYSGWNAARKRLRCVMPGCPGFYLAVFNVEPDGSGKFYGWSPFRRYASAPITHDNKGIPGYVLCVCSRGNKCKMPVVHISMPPQEMLDMMYAADKWMDYFWNAEVTAPIHMDGLARAYDEWDEIATRLRSQLQGT